MARLADLAGQRFGRLVAIKLAGRDKWNKPLWKCLCNCGNYVVVKAMNICAGRTKSCGCYLRESSWAKGDRAGNGRRLEPGIAARNHLITTYRRNAKLRRIEWGLSHDEATLLFGGNCYYCGGLPYRRAKTPSGNGDFTYNGIDRKNATMAYVPSNCVPCCWSCNKLKGSRTAESFLSEINKIAANVSRRWPEA